MDVTSWRFGIILLAIGLPSACSGPIPDEESTPSVQFALSGKDGRLPIASPYLRLRFLPAGVAADREVVFVGAPLEGRVFAMDTRRHLPLGELPVPPAGFVLPFIAKSVGSGEVAILDAGGVPSPSPFAPANPTIHEYSYRVGAKGEFEATLVRSLSFAGALVGFAEDIVRLKDGTYVLSDAVLGALWLVSPDGAVRTGIGAKTRAPEDEIPELKICDDMPQIDVGGLPFVFSGDTIPGVSSLVVRDTQLYFSSPCAGGLYRVPLATLFDSRLPHERASDIRLVSQKADNVLVEQLLGLTVDARHPNEPYIYAADSLRLRIVRIDIRNGGRMVIASDPPLFNFPSSMAMLPHAGRESSLLVVSNQQHRLPLTNMAISEDISTLPFLVTEINLRY
jgi:hypothetical protein